MLASMSGRPVLVESNEVNRRLKGFLWQGIQEVDETLGFEEESMGEMDHVREESRKEISSNVLTKLSFLLCRKWMSDLAEASDDLAHCELLERQRGWNALPHWILFRNVRLRYIQSRGHL